MCSPGVFSLVRGSALIEDQVLTTYATRSNKARHYVQYDQGEDRWLTTLIIQQGYYIVYCSSATCMTYSPEGFEVKKIFQFLKTKYPSLNQLNFLIKRNIIINVEDGYLQRWQT